MALRGHPFSVFTSSSNARSFYRRTFFNRLRNSFVFLSGLKEGGFYKFTVGPIYGILEILLFPVLYLVLGLSKLIRRLFPRIGKAMEFFFKCMLLYIPAAILTVVFSPVIYLVHKLTQYRGRILINRIRELQVVPMEPDSHIENHFGSADNASLQPYEKELIHRYQEFCLQTIPLKDHRTTALVEHLDSDDFEEKFVLKRIPKERKEGDDEDNQTEYSEIFGLFPGEYYQYFQNLIPGYTTSNAGYARPLALVVPSKKNRHEFEAVLNYGIFSNYTRTHSTSQEILNEHAEQDVLQSLNHSDPYIPKLQGALLTLLRARDTSLEDSTIRNNINPLLPFITDFAGFSTVHNQQGTDEQANESLRQFNNNLDRTIQLQEQKFH